MPTSLLPILSACGLWSPAPPAPDPPAPAQPDAPAPPASEPPAAEPAAPPEAGRWVERADPDPDHLSDAQRAEIELLEAIGYADGTRQGRGQGVWVGDPARVAPGLNFYSSGHGPEAVLTDARGQVLHRWRRDFWEAFPDYPVSRTHGATHNWRRAWLLDRGHVLAIHEGLGMVRLDADSRVVWANPGRMHHDAEVVADVVWTLTRHARVEPSVHPERPILEDFAVALDLATGEERQRVSLLQAAQRSDFATLFEPRRPHGDIFHTNSLRVLTAAQAAAHPDFAPGHLLVSMRNIDTVAVVDPDRGRVVWAHRGGFRQQHDPTITADGELMVFDNRGGPRGTTRVVRYALPGMEQRWVWPPPDQPELLDSAILGAAKELPNGNVLVTESEGGRALELSPDGEVVWTFHSPHVAGPDDQFVAALFELARVPRDVLDGWTPGGAR